MERYINKILNYKIVKPVYNMIPRGKKSHVIKSLIINCGDVNDISIDKNDFEKSIDMFLDKNGMKFNEFINLIFKKAINDKNIIEKSLKENDINDKKLVLKIYEYGLTCNEKVSDVIDKEVDLIKEELNTIRGKNNRSFKDVLKEEDKLMKDELKAIKNITDIQNVKLKEEMFRSWDYLKELLTDIEQYLRKIFNFIKR